MNISVTITDRRVTVVLQGNTEQNKGIVQLLSGFEGTPAKIVTNNHPYPNHAEPISVKLIFEKPEQENDTP